MDLPLYLYTSPLNSDFALLSAPPAGVTDAASYVLFDKQPVGFAAVAPFSDADGVQSVGLTAYWSPTRKDIQTTNETLATLNAHGGDYVLLGGGSGSDSGSGCFAHVAGAGTQHYQPTLGRSTRGLAPLWLVYSDTRTDAITSPLNAADANAVVRGGAGAGAFRSTGTVLGYARQGTCALCNTGLSESFPSAGGADCMHACAAGEGSFGRAFHYGKAASMVGGAGSRAMQASMRAAGEVLTSYDSSVRPEFGTALHVSFTYSCCYNATARAVIEDVLDRQTAWDMPRNVTFDRAAWRIDNAGNPASHYSVCVWLDEPSNARMEQWVATVEAAVEAAGVPIHIPRAAQEPFHTTLAVVDGTTFPVEAALQRLNELIKPGTWTGTEPLVLTKPD